MTPSLHLRKHSRNLLILSLALCAIVAFAAPTLAQTPPPAPPSPTVCATDADCKGEGQKCESATCVYKLTNPLGTTSIPALVGRVVTIFTGISGSVALLMFIYGGFLWIFSGGEAERVQKGKDVMKWATIGLFIMFGAYALVKLVFQGFGV